MPKKIETETQLSRLLGNSPLQVDLTLLHTRSHQSKNTSAEHLFTFYKMFDDIKGESFDGMIITGAPVEQLPFEEVEYWDELCEIMEWSKSHVHSSLHICWGAQAGLYYHFGIKKYPLAKKLFGVYPHKVDYKRSILFRGFDDKFMVPQSRHTTLRAEEILAAEGLRILSSSVGGDPYVISAEGGKQIFVTGHSEYDAETLKSEYLRDISAGLDIAVPENYFPDNDPAAAPPNTWRAHANLLYSNWLNYFVYQTTPYSLNSIGKQE